MHACRVPRPRRTRRDRPRRSSSHYASDLAFDRGHGLGVLEHRDFGAYLAAHLPAVYASWPRSPVYFWTTTQDSLPTRGVFSPRRRDSHPGLRIEVSGATSILFDQAFPGARPPALGQPRSTGQAAIVRVCPPFPQALPLFGFFSFLERRRAAGLRSLVSIARIASASPTGPRGRRSVRVFSNRLGAATFGAGR